ncbi:hypothetical protein ACFL6K_00065 [Candidatus Latescibacterota bacterium]
MITVQKMKFVAVVEARLLVRSWSFRFLSFLSIAGLLVANVLIFIPQNSWAQLSPWMLRSIPSSVPYFNIFVMTSFQSLMIIIGVAESLHRDSTYDTYHSLQSRNYSNLNYILGKAIGILMPLIVLSVSILTMALIINGLFMEDVPIVWSAYLLYPLLINIPALVFIVGISLALAILFRSTPFVLISLLAVMFLPILITDGLFARMLDYNAIHLPMLFSDFVGFGNIGEILLHQGMFLFLGLGLIMLSAMRFKRLPQSRESRKITIYSGCAFAVCALLTGSLFVNGIIGKQNLRERMQALNKEYVTLPRARMTACSLDVTHHGSSLSIEALLTLANHRDVTLDRICLSLNQRFKIDSITSNGLDQDYKRDAQIIDIALNEPLVPGESMNITVSYHGAPDDRAMYPDIPQDEHMNLNRLFTYVIDKRHAFVTSDYILLTPESLWYPVSGIPYGVVFPDAYEKDFIDFTLDIATGEDLTVISQGEVTAQENGDFSVRPQTKLTGMTLIAGKYEKRSYVLAGETKQINREGDTITYNDLELVLYTRPGHDYFAEYFRGDQDDFFKDLARNKSTIERNNGKFPYLQYYFVEAPVQFYAYDRYWGTHMDTVQPQMDILPEKGCFLPDLDLYWQYGAAYSESFDMGREATNKRIPSMVSRNIINRVFEYDTNQKNHVNNAKMLSKESFKSLITNLDQAYMPGYSVGAQYSAFLHSVESVEFPMISSVFERHQKGAISSISYNDNERGTNALNSRELASLALMNKTFREYLNTSTDIETISCVLDLKTIQLFSQLRAHAGSDDFYGFINDILSAHRFERLPLELMIGAVDSTFGMDFKDIFNEWSNEQELPVFEFSDISCVEVATENQVCYQTMITIANISEVCGNVNVFHMGGNAPAKNITFEGMQTKEIGFIHDKKPSAMRINTILSQNIPLAYTEYLKIDDKSLDSGLLFDGERIVEISPDNEPQDVIVVDNLDSGFEIVTDTPRNSDSRNYGFGNYPDNFIRQVISNPPSRWGKAVFSQAYGIQRTALYTNPLKGERSVCWTAEITESGWYDLEYYIPDIIGATVISANFKFLGDYTLTISYGEKEETKTFEPKEPLGWQYISSYELDPGTVKVYLSNKSDGKIVYADAIRWVKK